MSDSTIESWLLSRSRSLIWNSKRTVAKSSLFNIPENLVALPSIQQDTSEQDTIDFANAVVDPTDTGKGKTCLACGLRFSDRSEQAQHFKSDFHLLNLKRKLRNLPTISQAEFDSLSEDASVPALSIESKDGDDGDQLGDGDSSASDSGEEDPDADEPGTTAADKSKSISERSEGVCVKMYSNKTGHQLLYRRADDQKYEIVFNSSALYTSNFIRGTQRDRSEDSLWRQLRDTIALGREADGGGMWTVLILRSGRFAGAIFRKHELIAHKVFRRYTVRAKAGGSQSSHDNQAGKANSMGAMLRRHGEQALKEDIQTLLLSWSCHLDTCTKLLLSAPKTLYHVLFEYPQSVLQQAGALEPPLDRTDARICHIPFMVGKPTLEEARAVYDKCTSVVFRQIQRSGAANPIIAKDETGSQKVDSTELDKSGFTENVGDDLDELDAMLLSDLSFYEENKHSILGTIHERDEGRAETPRLALPDSEPSRLLIAACRAGDLVSVKRILHELRSETESSTPAVSGPATATANNSEDENESDDDDDNDKVADGAQASFNKDSNLCFVLGIPESIESLQSPLHIAADLGHTDIVRALLAGGANPCQVDARNRTAYHLAKTKPVRDAFRWVRGSCEGRWNWDQAGVPSGLTAEKERDQKEKEKEKKKRQKEKKKQEKERDAQEKELKLKEAERQKQELIQRMSAPCDHCGKPMGLQAMIFLDKKVCSGACSLALRRKLAAEAALNRLGK